MLFLETLLLFFPHLHDGAHVDFIKGGEHRGLIFHFDELLRNDAAQFGHFLAGLAAQKREEAFGRCGAGGAGFAISSTILSAFCEAGDEPSFLGSGGCRFRFFGAPAQGCALMAPVALSRCRSFRSLADFDNVALFDC